MGWLNLGENGLAFVLGLHGASGSRLKLRSSSWNLHLHSPGAGVGEGGLLYRCFSGDGVGEHIPLWGVRVVSEFLGICIVLNSTLLNTVCSRESSLTKSPGWEWGPTEDRAGIGLGNYSAGRHSFAHHVWEFCHSDLSSNVTSSERLPLTQPGHTRRPVTTLVLVLCTDLAPSDSGWCVYLCEPLAVLFNPSP